MARPSASQQVGLGHDTRMPTSPSATPPPTKPSRTTTSIPTTAFVAPLEINPQIIMWDPDDLPRRRDDRRPRHAKDGDGVTIRSSRPAPTCSSSSPTAGHRGAARRQLRRRPLGVHRRERRHRPAGLRLGRAVQLRERLHRLGQAGRLRADPRRRLADLRGAARRARFEEGRAQRLHGSVRPGRPAGHRRLRQRPGRDQRAGRRGGQRVQRLLDLRRGARRCIGASSSSSSAWSATAPTRRSATSTKTGSPASSRSPARCSVSRASRLPT